MNNTIRLIIELSFIGAFMYCIVRGGAWKAILYKNNPPFDLPAEDVIHGAVFALVFMSVSGLDYRFGLLALGGMVAGSTPRWGEYISAMLGTHPEETVSWGIKMMTMRGCWGGVFCAIPALVADCTVGLSHASLYALAVILAGLAQGLVYYGAIRIFKNFEFQNETLRMAFNHWTVGEMVFGALLWVPLACLHLAPAAEKIAYIAQLYPFC